MNNTATLDDMIIQYSENPFVDEMQYKAFTTYDRIKKSNILNRLLYMSNLISENKMVKEVVYQKPLLETVNKNIRSVSLLISIFRPV